MYGWVVGGLWELGPQTHEFEPVSGLQPSSFWRLPIFILFNRAFRDAGSKPWMWRLQEFVW